MFYSWRHIHTHILTLNGEAIRGCRCSLKIFAHNSVIRFEIWFRHSLRTRSLIVFKPYRHNRVKLALHYSFISYINLTFMSSLYQWLIDSYRIVHFYCYWFWRKNASKRFIIKSINFGSRLNSRQLLRLLRWAIWLERK